MKFEDINSYHPEIIRNIETFTSNPSELMTSLFRGHSYHVVGEVEFDPKELVHILNDKYESLMFRWKLVDLMGMYSIGVRYKSNEENWSIMHQWLCDDQYIELTKLWIQHGKKNA